MNIILDMPEGIISEILSFVESNLKLSTIESEIMSFIHKTYEKIISMDDTDRQNAIDKLENYSVYDLQIYNRKDYSNHEIYRFMMWCSMIKHALKIDLVPGYKEEFEKFESYGKLERQISPPLEAYEWKSFNKMNITHSDKSYGLLFE